MTGGARLPRVAKAQLRRTGFHMAGGGPVSGASRKPDDKRRARSGPKGWICE